MVAPEFTGPFKVGDLILGDYEVIGLLGAGGHAYVYECLDRYMDAVVAVKVISSVLGRGKDLLGRAHAEAKLLFKLNHPNVVRVITARPIGESMVCIVMEKLDGLSLRQFLRFHGRLTVTEALHIVRQIAVGVGGAHRLEVIHRDIKPENVFLLPPNSHVKVLDFGIAKFLGQGLETTNKARIHGTPYYMSPEHLQGIDITVRSDIYELGTLAFELMTGKLPCLVDLENPDFNQLAYVQISKVTPPLTRLIREVGPRTEYLIQRSTAKEPTQRFASMDQVIEAVDAALLEQKTLYPREADAIRFLDEETTRAARLREVRDEEDEGVSAPSPDGNEHNADTSRNDHAPATATSTKDLPGAEANQRDPRPRPGMSPTVEISGSRRSASTNPVSAEPATTNSPTTSSVVAQVVSEEPASSGNPQQHESRRRRGLPRSIVVAPIALGLAVTVAMSWSDIRQYESRRGLAASGVTSRPSATLISPDVPVPESNSPVSAAIAIGAAGAPASAPTTISATERQNVAVSPQERRSRVTSQSSDAPIERLGSFPAPSGRPNGAIDPKRAFASDLGGPAAVPSRQPVKP